MDQGIYNKKGEDQPHETRTNTQNRRTLARSRTLTNACVQGPPTNANAKNTTRVVDQDHLQEVHRGTKIGNWQEEEALKVRPKHLAPFH